MLSLLVKLPTDTIILDPTSIGKVMPERKKRIPTKQEKEFNIEAVKGSVSKKKTKRRNKLGKRATKKKEMIANAKRPFLEQQMKEEEQVAREKLKTTEQVELSTTFATVCLQACNYINPRREILIFKKTNDKVGRWVGQGPNALSFGLDENQFSIFKSLILVLVA